MSRASPVTPSDLPDAQDVKACIPIYEAIIFLGRLYSDVAAIAQVERPDLYELAALAAWGGRGCRPAAG